MKVKSILIDKTANCESRNIGNGTAIGSFVHIMGGAKIGQNCNIASHVVVENDVSIGDRVIIKPHVHISDGTHLGSDIFVGPNSVFSDKVFDRSKSAAENCVKTCIEDGVFIGANSTILAGLHIGIGAVVAAGSVVTKNVPAGAVLMGNPGEIVGYVNRGREQLESISYDNGDTTNKPGIIKKLPSGASLVKLPEIVDLRGKLSFAEVNQYLPFTPQRYFLVYGVPNQEVRGEHAHKECHQFLVCVSGSLTLITDNGHIKDQVILNTPTIGLLIPATIWGIQFKFTSDAVLLVLASHVYDSSDYVRDYNEFLRIKRAGKL